MSINTNMMTIRQTFLKLAKPNKSPLKQLLIATTVTTLLNGCLYEGAKVDTPPVTTAPPVVVVPPVTAWTMVFEDQFDGSALNTDIWQIQTGDGSEYGLPPGWGNNEKQWYSADNVSLNAGELVISAREEASNGMPYTSGRLMTKGKMDFQYGRVEARVKVPKGKGLWSAFWALPTDSVYGGWPTSGEIDIMEVFNAFDNDAKTLGTLHYGMAWPNNVFTGHNATINNIDDYHIYAVEWEQDQIRWYLDNIHFATIDAATWWSYYYDETQPGYVSAPANAPFNQKFHLLLNLAVDGNLPGAPDANTVFPAQMQIDYVKVFKCDADPVTGAGCASTRNPTVVAPGPSQINTTSYTLYTGDESANISWQVAGETLSRELTVAAGWTNDGALTVEQIDNGDDHGKVIDINTSNAGNVVINAVDGDTFALTGMGSSAKPWEAFAGEIRFDLWIDSSATDDAGSLLIKMDSGWPALGQKALNIADLAKDQWITVSVQVNDLLNNPGEQALDMSKVLNLFIIEFTANAHVKVDNVQLGCGHPNTCGISAPVVEVLLDSVDLFVDSVNQTLWTNGAGAWDTVANNYLDGTTSNHINWSAVDSSDSARGKVLAVNFNADGNNGVFYIQSAQGVDLSRFAEAGKLSFDIKVTNYAGNTDGMVLKVDCSDPCGTGEIPLGVVGNGEWQTVTYSVADMIGRGLDITKVNSPIVLFPTWGQQQGVTFELDNIRWQISGVGQTDPGTGGGGSTEAALTIYADGPHADWPLWDCCGGAIFTELADDDSHGTVAEFTFNGAGGTVVGFLGSNPFDASGISGGTLSFDLKMLAAPTAGGAWTLKVEGSNANVFAEVLLSESNEGQAPALDTWQHFTFNLSALAADGLDLSQIKIIMVFPTWEQAQGAVYRIDNVLITP